VEELDRLALVVAERERLAAERPLAERERERRALGVAREVLDGKARAG
jgi:hypothetical protein